MAILKRALVVLLFLFLGGILTFIGGKQIAEGFASRNWLPTQGKVIDSHVDSRTVTKKSGNSRRTTTEYTATIRYSYTVGGRDFTGDRLSVERSGYTSSNRSAAYQVAERYPVGSAVTVHYDPHNPATAVLQAGAAGVGSWAMLVVGLVLIAGAGLVGLVLRRYSPAPRAASTPATGFGSVPTTPATAQPYRTATPTDAAAARAWQPGAVPHGVITDWTARFLGPAEAWRSARVSVSNLRGGQHIQLAGAGQALIRLAPTPQDQQLHVLNLTHAETRQLLSLFAQHDFLTITFPARPLVPDGSATTLTLRNAVGQEFTLTHHDHDLDEGGRFAAIAAPLLALVERLDTDQPRTEVALTVADSADKP